MLQILFILICLNLSPCYGDWHAESKKIDYLFSAIESSEAIFIRNGKEYSPKETADHLKVKLKNAQARWFSPSQEKWTAKMFITEVATGSSLSGKPYLIKEKNKAEIEASVWLTERLNDYEKSNPDPLFKN